MNFTQIISVFTFTGLLFISCSAGLRFCSIQEKENLELRKQVDCFKFVSKSFVNTCQGKGFKDLNQWQKTCRALWDIQYIGWSSADDFLEVPENKKNNLFYGTWKSDISNGEVYSLLHE